MDPDTKSLSTARKRLLRALIAGCCAAIAACGGPSGPEWRRLAEGYRPAALEGQGAVGMGFRLFLEDGRSWLRTSLPRAEWKESAFPGSWEAPLRVQGMGKPSDGSPPLRLVADGRSLSDLPVDRAGPDMEREPGTFVHAFGRVFLFLEEGEQPPEETALDLYADRGRAVNGTWRVSLGRLTGEGLSVWPGERDAVRVDVPPASALRFATCARSALVDSDPDAEVGFEVWLDGERLFEETLNPAPDASAGWHEVSLPSEGRANAELEFRVTGPTAYTAFLQPVIGPADVGTYAKRPWKSEQPDIVVFLADTFRADNLAAYGGELDLTPAIDAFAEESLVFDRAWSVATHTLPAHGSMFAGMYPRQHSASGWDRALPDDLVTIAEVLQERGYRTGAVTDSVMVSSLFGVDQGFGWFDEQKRGPAWTLERARAFLEADDGRPVFLFVQSYRTHTPYEVPEDIRAEHGERLGLGARTFAELEDVLRNKGGKAWFESAPGAAFLGELRAMYHAGVIDLDAAFGELREDLETLGVLERGYLLFASDHGEAFREHEELFHSGRAFEEQVRVPLLLAGPRFEAGREATPVSLVDFAPTLADVAGVPAPSQWLGRSLLSELEPRPLFAFQCAAPMEESSLAMLQGDRKLMSLEDADALRARVLWAAYDLGRDPGEVNDVLEGDVSWPAELAERLAPTAKVLLEPLVGEAASVLDAADLERLREMGYAGD